MVRRAPSTSPNTSQPEGKAEARWGKTPAIMVAIIAVLAAISVALIHQRTAPKPKSSEPTTIDQQTHGPNSPAFGHVQGDVYVAYGISEEKFRVLAGELGVTDAALKSFFNILEQQHVPREDLNHTLRDIAKNYKTLQERLQAFTSDDPVVSALKREASQALEAGDFARAEQRLNEASAKDLESARQLQETATNRLLSAAASKADNGQLQLTQLRYTEAVTYYRQAAELVESLPHGSEEKLATYLNAWGFALHQAGEYRRAEIPLTRALAIREKALGPEHPDVATSLNNLAGLYYAQGRYAEAEPFCQRALAIWEKGLGPEHPNVALGLNNLAGLYYAQGRYVEVEPFYQRALAIREKALGPEHPDVATSLNNLAGLYRAQGRYVEVEPFYQRALAIREKALGPEHPDVATSLNDLALLYYEQGRYAEAEPFYQRALAIREKGLGPEHPNVALGLNNLALLYYEQGRYAEAEPFYQRALAIWEKGLGPEHPDVALGLNNLAGLYRAQGRYVEAEPFYQRALAIWEKGLGPEHPDVATGLENYAMLLRATHRPLEADTLEIRAKTIRSKHTPANPGP